MVQVAIFFIVLLFGSEAIAINARVREHAFFQRIGDMRMRKELRARGEHLKSAREDLEKQCNNREANATPDGHAICRNHENRAAELHLLQIYESIHSAFTFRNSPVKKDCLALPKLVYQKDVPMSPKQIESYQKEATLFMEKASQHISAKTGWGILGKVVSHVAGKASSAVQSMFGKESKAKAEKEEVGRANEVMGEGLSLVMSDVDSDALNSGPNDTEHLTVLDVLKSILYGVTNGFFAGMVEDLDKDFSDESCKKTGPVKEAFKDAAAKTAAFWETLLSAWKNVWTSKGRGELMDAVKLAFGAWRHLFGELFTYVATCKGCVTVVFMFGIIGIALGLNALMIAAGAVVIPIIVKIAGIILEVVFGIPFLIKVIKRAVEQIKLARQGKCGKDCKKMFIRVFGEIVGFLIQVVLMSGNVMKFAPKSGTKLGRFKWNPTFVDDMKVLKSTVNSAMKGKRVTAVAGDASKFGTDVGKTDSMADIAASASKSEAAEVVSAANKLDNAADAAKSADDAADAAKSADDAADAAKSADAADSGADTGWKTTVGENTGGKGTEKNPMSFDEAKQFDQDGKYAYDRYSEKIPDAMKSEQDNFIGGRFNEIKIKADPNSDEVVTLYRAGDDSRDFGQYWTRDPPNSATDVHEMAAVKTDWTNTHKMSNSDLGKHYDAVVHKQGNRLENLRNIEPRKNRETGIMETKDDFIARLKKPPEQATTVYKIEIPVKDLPKEGLVMFEGKVASQSDSLAVGIDVKATGGGDQIFMSGKQSFTANSCANCKITKIGGFEESRRLREGLGLPQRL